MTIFTTIWVENVNGENVVSDLGDTALEEAEATAKGYSERRRNIAFLIVEELEGSVHQMDIDKVNPLMIYWNGKRFVASEQEGGAE